MSSKIVISFILLFVQAQSYGQKKWTLEQCINYAIENNISVKQQVLNVHYGKNQFRQSKYNLTPKLQGSVNHAFNYGRSLTQLNTYINSNSQNTELTVNGEVTLFNGLAKLNTIKKHSLELKAYLNDLEKTKDDITLNVLSVYYDILFKKELVTLTKEQISITEQQIKNSTEKVKAGYLSNGKLLETKVQLAQEVLTLTNYKNDLKSQLLTLMQLLELPIADTFDINTPVSVLTGITSNLDDPIDIFQQAEKQRPEILSKVYRMQSSHKDVLIAKANLYPVLTAGTYIYTNYNDNYQFIDGSGNIPLGKQLENNGQIRLFLSLRIPIIDGFSARTTYQNSQINYENSKLDFQLEKNNLLKTIQQVHLDAISAREKFYSSRMAAESANEAFYYVEEKFNLGIVTPLEYNDAKNRVTNAESSLIQAKYEYVFRTKILDFYMGKPIIM